VKCCMCKRKVRRNSVPLDKYALQAAQLCRVPLLSMTSNNTWDYFDASSDKNRVVWYWIASVVQSTIDLGTNFSVATARERSSDWEVVTTISSTAVLHTVSWSRFSCAMNS